MKTRLLVLCCGAWICVSAQNCPDFDFENYPVGAISNPTALAGSMISTGNHGAGGSNCNSMNCCTMAPNGCAILDATNGITETALGNYTVYSVFGSTPGHTNAPTVNPHMNTSFGGSKVLRMNFGVTTGASKLTRTLSVTSSNCLLQFAFIAVIDIGHDCCNGPAVYATVGTNTCPVFYVSGAGVNPCPGSNEGMGLFTKSTGTTYTPSAFGGFFTKWEIRSADLRAYIGQTVAINILASACVSGGHFGHAYIDMACSAFSITTNGIASESSTICAGASPTIAAPPHFSNFLWEGPGGFSESTAQIQPTVSGIYTLTTHNGIPCAATSQTVQVVIGAPTHSVSTTNNLSCAKNAVTLMSHGMSSIKWNNSSTSLSISVSPSVTTTYSFSGLDNNGCSVTAVHVQSVQPCTGIANYVDDLSVTLFPNPTQGSFTIELPVAGELRIESMTGQLLHVSKLTAGRNDISLQLRSGIYVWKVSTDDNRSKSGRMTVERQ